MTNSNNYYWHYSFNISGDSASKSGVPCCGTILAPTLEEATKLVDLLGKQACINLEELFAKNRSFLPSLSHTPLSYVNVNVFKSTIIDEWGDCHNPSTRNLINEIWANEKGREMLKPIVKAYFERDCEELANFYSDECVWWKMNEVSYEEALELVSFEDLCEVLFSHIFDDGDLGAIISYVRPTWICETWWEFI